MNLKANHNTRLILASRSPRRSQLLREAGFKIEQINSPFEDPAQPVIHEHGNAADLAVWLSTEKAKALASQIQGKAVIIAADTICVDDQNNLIGTPETKSQAHEMIQTFRNAIHYVITGVTILIIDDEQLNDQGQTVRPIALNCFFDEAIVMLGHLEDEQIDQYLNLNTWQGKAGGYNLTERQEAGWPIIVNGEPSTVVGLPMPQTIAALDKFGITAHTNP